MNVCNGNRDLMYVSCRSRYINEDKGLTLIFELLKLSLSIERVISCESGSFFSKLRETRSDLCISGS